MITINTSSIKSVEEDCVVISGTNDLGMEAVVGVSMGFTIMNAFRISLQMLTDYPDSTLPPSKTGSMKALSESVSYADDINATGYRAIPGIRVYRTGDTVKILLSGLTYESKTYIEYHPWYSSKSLLTVNLSIDNCHSIIDKLNKFYPYEQFSPENEPCYKYITS